jgi:hypothetical protein
MLLFIFFRSESINPGKETHCLKMNTLKLPQLKRAKPKKPTKYLQATHAISAPNRHDEVR